jgi:ABC-type branched-subunit amino acid transport system ATPase component
MNKPSLRVGSAVQAVGINVTVSLSGATMLMIEHPVGVKRARTGRVRVLNFGRMLFQSP